MVLEANREATCSGRWGIIKGAAFRRFIPSPAGDLRRAGCHSICKALGTCRLRLDSLMAMRYRRPYGYS